MRRLGAVRRAGQRPRSRLHATELTRPLVDDEEFSAWVRRRTPAGRWGSRDDLVGGVLFLASPASDFVSGQVLCVDGGMTSVL